MHMLGLILRQNDKIKHWVRVRTGNQISPFLHSALVCCNDLSIFSDFNTSYPQFF